MLEWTRALLALGLAFPAAASTDLSLDRRGMPMGSDAEPLACPSTAGDGRYVTTWSGADRRVQGTCRGGLAVGTWRAWHSNGRVRWDTTFAAGLLEGEWRTWYENGTLQSQGTFEEGQAHGRFTYWYRDGTLRSRGRWLEGREAGCWREHREDGSRYRRGAYVDGVRVGRWVIWEPDGSRRRVAYGSAPSQGRCLFPWF